MQYCVDFFVWASNRNEPGNPEEVKVVNPNIIVRLAWPSLIFLLGACGAPDNVGQSVQIDDPYRLNAIVVPTFQQLSFDINPEETEYRGETTIALSLREPVSEFRLHAKDMQIDHLQISHGDRVIPTDFQFGEHGLLTIVSTETLPAGDYELLIEFTNDFNTNGVGINRTEQEGRYYVFSQFEAIDARQAFPCFDEPAYKIPWQLTMTVPEHVMAITNTPASVTTVDEGRATTVFETTPPLPSYLIAVAVGPFEAVPIPGMSVPGRVITPHGKAALAAAAVKTTPPLLASLEEYFGQPYPFAKLDLIATNQAFSGAMEHPGAITYSDFFLLLDETASRRQMSTLVRITAHELAHQWFGNLVTMSWWNDLWLNESFADWMGDKTVEAVYPEYGGALSELRTTFRIMDSDARPSTKAIRHNFTATDNFSDGIFLSYYKGKSVISMFEKAIGPAAFREGVVQYLERFSRGNASAAEFWAMPDLGADFDLAAAFVSFIDQPGIPLVSVEAVGDGQYAFTQSRFTTGNIADVGQQLWTIPVTYKYRVGEEILRGELLLDSESEMVRIEDAVEWILPNAEQQGYFRWEIPSDMFSSLAADASARLSVRERMGLPTNLWALLSTGKIGGEAFVAALQSLSVDTDPSVLAANIDQLHSIWDTFISPDLRRPFARYVQTLLKPALGRIGAHAIEGESAEQESLRTHVLGWLADEGADPEAQRIIDQYVNGYLAGDIPPSALVEMSLTSVARRGDRTLFERYVPLLEASSTPGERRRYLAAIGSFRDPELVEAVLAYVLANPLRPNDVSSLVRRLAAWEDNHGLLLEWFMANDEHLRGRLPEGSMLGIPDMFSVCSWEHWDTIKAFYGAEERQVPGIEGELADAEAEITECVELRRREQGAVARYLRDL